MDPQVSLVACEGWWRRKDGERERQSSLLLPFPRGRRCNEVDFFSSLFCSYTGISDAYYCTECTRLEKDRDGCPKIVNLGASRTDLFYERK